jgi:hypothetical protein
MLIPSSKHVHDCVGRCRERPFRPDGVNADLEVYFEPIPLRLPASGFDPRDDSSSLTVASMRSLRLDRPSNGSFIMTGLRPTGRPWTSAEEAQLCELLISRAKVGLIAKKLKRSPGAVYARINALKRPRDLALGRRHRSLPSERRAHAKALNSKPEC